MIDIQLRFPNFRLECTAVLYHFGRDLNTLSASIKIIDVHRKYAIFSLLFRSRFYGPQMIFEIFFKYVLSLCYCVFLRDIAKNHFDVHGYI